MDKWKSALALAVAGVMLAGTALAQSGTTGTKSGDMKPGMDMKSGDMKSGDMKSGDMKSGMDMKSKSSGKMARSGGADQVKAVQQALKDKGMDPGEVDGKMGPKTQSALRDYQKKEGLKENGRLDTETMTKLGVAKTSDTGSTTPSASPSTGSSTEVSPSAGAGAATGSGSSSVPSKQTR